MQLKFVKLDPAAIIPCRKHETDSGYDVCTTESMTLGAGERYAFATGIAAAIPKGYEIQVRPRSGLSSKHGVVAVLGTVDEGYRGEIRVILVNVGKEPYTVQFGERVAQLVIAKREDVEVVEGTQADLTATDRGIDGFGSSGR